MMCTILAVLAMMISASLLVSIATAVAYARKGVVPLD